MNTTIRPRSETDDRPRPWVAIAVLVAAAFAVPATAAAQVDGGGDADARVTDAPDDRRFETLKLGCSLRRVDDGPAVHCRWTPPTIDAAAGVRLWRVTVGDDGARTVVFRTDDLSVSSYTDAAVRPGHRYRYVVQAVNPTGRTVGLSRAAAVGVPVPPDDPPSVEVLRLECEVAARWVVGCSWSLPSEARTLTLWRSVDGGPREVVVSSGHPFPSAYRDTVPDGTSRVAYAVTASAGSDRVVARSRAEHVRFPDVAPPTTDTVPVDTRPVDTRPVDTRPVDTRPVGTRPVDTRPVDTRPVDTRPVDTRPVDTRPVDTRPVDTRPVDTRPVDTRPVDTRPVDVAPVGTRPARDANGGRD